MTSLDVTKFKIVGTSLFELIEGYGYKCVNSEIPEQFQNDLGAAIHWHFGGAECTKH